MFDQPGLTVARFFESMTDETLRRFFEPAVLRVLDALFGGRVGGPDLRRVASTVLDIDVLAADSQGRRLLLAAMPEGKREELEARVERSSDPDRADEWAKHEVALLCEFFGLYDEHLVQPLAAETTVVPEFGLFDHQRGAVRELLPLLAEGDRRAVLHLPTGVGKTRTAMHAVARVLHDNDPAVVVWLASGRELLDQALDAFEQAWIRLGNRPLKTGLMRGDAMPHLAAFNDGFLAVGLAKGWAALSGSEPDWTTRLAPRVRLVVFDAAHQSIARTYRRITEELTMDYRCALLGLTATPGRTWADIDEDGRLAEFYSGNKVTLHVPGGDPISYLVDNGYLARPTFRTLLAEPGLRIDDRVSTLIAESLDVPDTVVASMSMSEQYVAAVLRAVEELLDEAHRRIIVFAASVPHARLLTAILLARDVASHAVTGETRPRARARAIRAFKAEGRKPMVLVNFGVLTTGFDAPQASAAVIARPTKSLVLYSQMVGRAIRGPKAGGTDACTVVTVVDPALPGFGDVASAFSNWEDVWH